MDEFTLDECAEGLCEQDACLADAFAADRSEIASIVGWAKSSDERRDLFRQKARSEIASGRYVLGAGWVDAD